VASHFRTGTPWASLTGVAETELRRRSGTGALSLWHESAVPARARWQRRVGRASGLRDVLSTVTALDVSYIGEIWRAGVTNRNAADRLDFQLSTNATSLTTGTWVDYNSLDFSSPTINTTAGALNGNSSPNQTPVSFSITSLSIADGASFWIRWSDFDIAPGADDGLAVDTFALTPRVFDLPPEVTSTFPANGATDFPVNANLSVTFIRGLG